MYETFTIWSELYLILAYCSYTSKSMQKYIILTLYLFLDGFYSYELWLRNYTLIFHRQFAEKLYNQTFSKGSASRKHEHYYRLKERFSFTMQSRFLFFSFCLVYNYSMPIIWASVIKKEF
jgi:hypothetical protein